MQRHQITVMKGKTSTFFDIIAKDTKTERHFRSMEPKSMSNLPSRSDTVMQPNTPSSSRRYEAKNEPTKEKNPVYNLKNLLFPPGRLTRPNK